MFQTLQQSNIFKAQIELLRKPSSTRPAVYVIEENGLRAVVKDFSSNRFLYRSLIGRFLVWRENKAYRRLKGVKGTPVLYRVLNGSALILERIRGVSLEKSQETEKLPPVFFEDLRKVVEEFHSRGICHCDLKRAANILVGTDGKPYVLDWSAAILQTEFRIFPLNLIYERFILDDLNAVTKFQLRNCPETVTPEDRERYLYRSKAEKMIRLLRDRMRELLQRLA
jgi:RIO-like serine/threonine protein kinase